VVGQPDNLFTDAQTDWQNLLKEQAVLLHVSQVLTSGVALAEVMAAILEGVLHISRADGARIVLRGIPDNSAFGAGDLYSTLATFDALTLDLSQENQPIIITDLSTASDLRYAPLTEHLGAMALWPLYAEGQHQGVLWLGCSTPYTWTEDQQTVLAVLAAQAATAAAGARARQEAEADRERLTAVLASTTDPVLVVDRERRVSLLNSAAERLVGADAPTVLLRPVADVLSQYPNLLRFFENDTILTGEEEWESQDGRTFSPHLSKVRSKSGEFGGWVLILRDITRFKLLNRNQAEFVRLVSHDLRSPLTFMQGFASLLQSAGNLNEKQVEFVEKILNGITQMSALVENIQDAGRWDPLTGSYEMSREPCDLAAMVREIVANHQGVAEKQTVRLSATIAPNIPIVNVDSLMIERALINLVSNAIKYSPNGGDVNVSIQLDSDAVLIRVSDTGLGIAPEHLPRLFQRGNRIITPEIKKNKIKGSGLGLFIVRSVAQRHGGDAWAESTLGQGSSFYFRIPLSGANLLGGSSG